MTLNQKQDSTLRDKIYGIVKKMILFGWTSWAEIPVRKEYMLSSTV